VVAGTKLVSPSLVMASGLRQFAYELKFLCTQEQADGVLAQLRDRLTPDPHAIPERRDGYQVASIYCDTLDRSVYHSVGRYGLFKLRARRYEQGEQVFLERKAKHQDRVRKRRTAIPLTNLNQHLSHDELAAWDGDWFAALLHRNQLMPACLLRYDRSAYFAQDGASPIRVTFDRNVCGAHCPEWSFSPRQITSPILEGRVICEFKYVATLPAFLKDVIADQRLVSTGISKYRQFVAAMDPTK